MLMHAIQDIERRCADYTLSLGIVCTYAKTKLVEMKAELKLAFVTVYFLRDPRFAFTTSLS